VTATPNPSLADAGSRQAGAAERGGEMTDDEVYNREVRGSSAGDGSPPLPPEKDVSEALER
jgi:hypothetical protein